MNQLDAMRCFARVAEFGSFSRAAQSLEVSRAVASAQVGSLEQHLGVRLLSRTTRRVNLTADGSAYLERCRRILSELDAADDEMRQLRERVQGRLRVDVPAMFGRHLLVPELPGFIARYPDLSLEIQYNDRMVDLGAERVDVAVRFSPRRDPKLVARPIGATRIVTYAAPSYLATHGVPSTPDELRGHRLVGQLHSGSARTRDWVFRVGAHTRRIPLPCPLVFNTIEGALQAAVSGLGVIQTADIIAQDLVRRGRLAVVLAGTAAPGSPASVVYQRANRVSAKIRVFADFVAAVFQRWHQTHGYGPDAPVSG